MGSGLLEIPVAGLWDAAGLGYVVWWHGRMLPPCHRILFSFYGDAPGSSAAPGAGKEMVIEPPPRVQRLLLLLLLHLGSVLAPTGGCTPRFSSSFEMHLLKIAGEQLEKIKIDKAY